LQQGYEKLLSTVGRVVGQAKRFSDEIAEGVKRSADVMEQAALKGLRQELDTIVPRVQQVIRRPNSGSSAAIPRRRETGQYLRTHDGNYSQGQGQQADGVWQDGQDPGRRESDYHRLCRIREAAQ